LSDRRPILYHNARVHTVDDRRPRATWFTVLGQRFQMVGEGPPPTVGRQVDLKGRTVVPGFVDAHAHFFQTGIDSVHIDLSGITARDALVEQIRTLAPKGGNRFWIFANRFEEETLTDAEQLTRLDLDRVTSDRPVWVNRVDYHSAVVNTAALRRLEIPPGTPGMLKGADGRPSGILRSEAYLQAKARVARLYSLETKDRALKGAVSRMLPHGVTAIHALEGGRVFGDEGVQVLLKRLQHLPLDVTIFLQEKNVYLTTRLGFDHLGGCILIDGSIGSYTAALNTSYRGMPGVRGTLYEKPRELAAFVEEAHVAGVQLAFHAIGPRAIEMVLNAYARALEKAPRYDHRHRIEHFELATDEQIRRAADLGLVVSMQPAFEHFWGGPDGMYASRLGDGWRQTNRLRTIGEAGLIIAGGSDTNVTPPHPMLGIHAAVNHPNEAERVDVATALRMMTLNAAYGAFNEKRHGSITPGKEANFAVLDRDPFRVRPDRLQRIRVQETHFRGRCVYRTGYADWEDDPQWQLPDETE
jgi:predicted amidohydrolase YtcJ